MSAVRWLTCDERRMAARQGAAYARLSSARAEQEQLSAMQHAGGNNGQAQVASALLAAA